MKRVLALVLALLMALPLFVACNTTGDTPDDTTTAAPGGETPNPEGPGGENENPVVTTEESFTPPEDVETDGTTLRVVSRVSDQPTGWGNYDIVYDEDSELVVTEIKNAIKTRNDDLLETLGVEVTQIAASNVYNTVYTGLNMGSDDYDMILPSVSDAGKLAQQGFLLAMSELEYVDTTKSWYDQRAFEQLAINGENYLFFSDITVVNLDATWLYYFNHKLIEKYNLENPYELLADYKWTIGKLVEMAEKATNDADGTPTKEDDWGIAGHDYIPVSLYHGTGMSVAKANADGEIEITMDHEDIYTFIAEVNKLHPYWARYCINEGKNYGNGQTYGFTSSDNYAQLMETYAAGKVLFLGEVLASARDLTALDTDLNVGILPTPMLEESQGAYYTPVNGIAACTAIPYTVADPVAMSVIIEYWAYRSSETLMPAYYEQAQKSRFSKDEISPDVIDMIFEAVSYDIGASYGWGALVSRLGGMIWNQESDWKSLYDSWGPVAESQLEIFMDNFVG